MKSLLKNSLLVAALATAFTASAFEYEGVIYEPIDDTTCKVGANGTTFHCEGLKFPETVYDGDKAYTLVEIGSGAFNSASRLYGDIYIPATVTKIGQSAFRATRPDKCTIAGENVIIEDFAFFQSWIKELEITGSVKSIGNGQFGNGQVFFQTNLAKVVFPEGLESIYGYGNFMKSLLTEVELPSTTQLVDFFTFNTCSQLKKITCKAMTPPGTSGYSIKDSSNIALYVPAGTKDAYAAATGWKDFGEKIYEIVEAGVAANCVNGAKVTARGGVINVEGAEGDVEVYNAVGQLLYKGAADAINVAGKGVHIVKVNGKAVKVAL